MIGTQGVDVPINVHGQLQYHSGSSFAQPQIASLVAAWKQEIGAGIIDNHGFLSGR